MKKFVFPFLVIAVVLIAGCTGGGGGAGPAVSGYGLEINSFSIEPSEIRSGNKATFVLTLEDKGNYKVDYKNASLLLTLPSDWSPAKSFENLSRTMNPADPSVDRVGDVVSEKFRPKAPSLLKGQARTDKITARAYYEYQTKANGFVYIYPFGEEIEETSSFKSTEAPIRIDVRTSPEAVVVEDADETFSLIIGITNVGSGKVYKPDITNGTKTPEIDSNDYNKVKLSIDISGEDWEHNNNWRCLNTVTGKPCPNNFWKEFSWNSYNACIAATDGYYYPNINGVCTSYLNCSCVEIKPRKFIIDAECSGIKDYGNNRIPIQQHYFSEYELFGKTNPTATIMCDVQVNHSIITTKTPVSIEVVARYGYYTETSGSIKIVGRQ